MHPHEEFPGERHPDEDDIPHTDPKAAALAHAMALGGYADPDPFEQWREPDATPVLAALAAAGWTLERAGLREALEGLLRATEFPAFDGEGQ